MTQNKKQIIKLAYPLLLSTLTFMVMHFCDIKFLANYSSEQMAAAMPCGTFLNAIGSFFLCLVNYTNILISQYYGAGNKKECVNLMWNGEYLSWICSAFYLITFPFLGYALLHFFIPQEIFKYGYTYFLILLPGQCAQLMAAPFSGFYSSRGYTAIISIVSCITALLNIFLDWIMIFGKWGCPAMGIAGAGIATSLSIMVGSAFITYYALFQPVQKIYPTRKLAPLNTQKLKKICKYGIPSSLKGSSAYAIWSLSLLIIGKLGANALASSSIAISIANIGNGPSFAIGRATEILAGQALGRKKPSEALRAMYDAWTIAIIYVSIMFIAILIWGHDAIRIFAPQNDASPENFSRIAEDAHSILITIGLWTLTDTAKIMPAALLQAAGDTRATFLINACTAWSFGLFSILVTVFVFHWPVTKVWYCWLIFSILEGSGMYLRVRSGQWKHIKMLS